MAREISANYKEKHTEHESLLVDFPVFVQKFDIRHPGESKPVDPTSGSKRKPAQMTSDAKLEPYVEKSLTVHRNQNQSENDTARS